MDIHLPRYKIISIGAPRYKFMKLLLKDQLYVWLQKSREAESLEDQREEMHFSCEQAAAHPRLVISWRFSFVAANSAVSWSGDHAQWQQETMGSSDRLIDY